MAKINSRQKGAAYEREVANYLDDKGFPSRRGQQFAGSPDGSSPDVVSDEFPFHIEAKRVEKLNLQSAFEQSTRDCGAKPPCVIHRKSRTDSLFTCRLDDILKFLRRTDDD